jgi:PLP dependent protein
MAFRTDAYHTIKKETDSYGAVLVAVSKVRTAAEIMEAYNEGHRDFGENYVQELLDKYEALPKDIRWHYIGHLQTNKVKFIAPFVHLIHSVDSHKLLLEINKQGKKLNRPIACLFQVHIAAEETKFGLNESELDALLRSTVEQESLQYVLVLGLMGMASFTEDNELIKKEFSQLKTIYDKYAQTYGFTILSTGMSADYRFALQAGSTMVRIGSMLFGSRIRTS